jgi:hypothetical protein
MYISKLEIRAGRKISTVHHHIGGLEKGEDK